MYVAAAARWPAPAVEGKQLELIVVGTTSYDDQVPNVASGHPAARRRRRLRGHGREHRLHQLPLLAIYRHRA